MPKTNIFEEETLVNVGEKVENTDLLYVQKEF